MGVFSNGIVIFVMELFYKNKKKSNIEIMKLLSRKKKQCDLLIISLL